MPPASVASVPSSESSAEIASNIKGLLQQPRNWISQEQQREDAARLDELRRVFSRLSAQAEFSANASLIPKQQEEESKDDSDKETEENTEEAARREWSRFLQTQHTAMTKQLCERIRWGKRYALRCMLGVIASTPQRTTHRNGEEICEVDVELVACLVDALCAPKRQLPSLKDNKKNKKKKKKKTHEVELPPGEMDTAMLRLLSKEFVGVYHDGQSALLLALKLVANLYRDKQEDKHAAKETDGYQHFTKDDWAQASDNLLQLLEVIKPPTETKDKDLLEGTFLFKPRVTEGSLKDSDDDTDDDETEEEDISSSSEDESDDDEDARSNKRKQPSTTTLPPPNIKKRRKRIQPHPLCHRRRRQWEHAWMSILRLPFLPLKSHRRALRALPTKVLDVVYQPLGFAEYLTRMYQRGVQACPNSCDQWHNKGAQSIQESNHAITARLTSLLALQGLYTLMTKYGLQYPEFFSSLYALVTPATFYAKYSSQFLSLLAQCLAPSSSQHMLPAYVVAAFCKRLCRCALVAPLSGGGCWFVLGLVGNLMRGHGTVACLVHRVGGKMEDVFDAETDDPLKSRALESSLWELQALQNHYHPSVAALARACGKPSSLQIPMHDMDDLLAHTYESLLEHETKRKVAVKKVTPVTFVRPKGLFGEGDGFGSFVNVLKDGGGGGEKEVEND